MRRPWMRIVALPLLAGVIVGCGESDAPDDVTQPVRADEGPQIMPAGEALAGAHIPTLDPAVMNDAEIRKALGPSPHCEFRYTSAGKPVLAVKARAEDGGVDGVIKLNGHLVLLQASAATDEIALADGEVRMTLAPALIEARETGLQEVNAIFEVNEKLRVGYTGYFRCVS